MVTYQPLVMITASPFTFPWFLKFTLSQSLVYFCMRYTLKDFKPTHYGGINTRNEGYHANLPFILARSRKRVAAARFLHRNVAYFCQRTLGRKRFPQPHWQCDANFFIGCIIRLLRGSDTIPGVNLCQQHNLAGGHFFMSISCASCG